MGGLYTVAAVFDTLSDKLQHTLGDLRGRGRLDGDARGGAALSVKAITGKPVKLASVGEKLDQIEYFHPDRMASRILGMGDVLTLIEKAEEAADQDEQARLEQQFMAGEFTFDDFLASY